MRIIKNTVLPFLLISLVFSGCSESKDNNDSNSKNETALTQTSELVVDPSVDYIVAGLSMVESVIGIEIDPNGGQGENVKDTVYFASDLLEQDDEDKTVAQIGTKGGGSIDIFSTVEDAKNRDEYLKKFDGKLIFDSGSHTVLGTIVIRTSSSLSKEKQNALTDEIIEILTSGVITKSMAEEAMKKLNAGDIEESKIKIGIDYADLLDIKYEEAQSKIKKAGFTNIKLVKVEADGNEKIEGKTSKISIDGNIKFSKNDKFLPTAEVIIYYQQAKKIKAPDVWYNLLERHYEEIEKLFRNAGFTNVKLNPCEVDYDETKTFEGSVVNICIGKDNVTFESDEEFYPSVEVRIDYRVKPKYSNSSNDEEIETNPYIEVNSYSVNFQTEYAHVDTDTIRLGNNEKAWITIKASPASLTADDFIFDYDGSMIEVTDINEIIDGNEVRIIYEIRSKKAGFSEIVIGSYYEVYDDYDNAEVYVLTVNGLNSEDGKVVYVSSTGEKYHYSSTCIEHAIKTTLDDALSYGYKPCSKCAK